MLVSAIQWSESAVCVHISPSSWTSLPASSHPFGSSESTELSSLSSTSQGGRGRGCGYHCPFLPEGVIRMNLFNILRFSEITVSAALPAAVAAAKSLLSCLTLCDPIDSSPPGSPVPGILQARTLEWVAISFSSAWKWKVKVKSLSCVRLLVTPWTTAYQAPPSMGFSGKSTGVGCHCFLGRHYQKAVQIKHDNHISLKHSTILFKGMSRLCVVTLLI